ncbi:MAG: tRNA pseudouridine(38-40) synthase TruA [Oscillospiraceae bacterium]|jgi:tRNA pseudouridine38-40 synthase|nr:tRNA pseudouridine(38-40) synthase TruA [Oscillospiraceae bacterium]
MKRNVLCTLAFDGSAFHGWQRQPNAFTAQQAVEAAVLRVTGENTPVVGCSRTDAGVHARMFCCHFRTQSAVPCAKLPAALNFYLPDALSVQCCEDVPDAFHARYDCKEKTYRYHLRNSRTRDPFLLRRAWFEGAPMDAALLHAQAQDFLGTHDFSSFCAAGADTKTAVRTVRRFEVTRESDDVFFTVAADGFLYNMVRIMVGTLTDIAKGKRPPGCIPGVLAAKNRAAAGLTAPAAGLFLWAINY